MKSSVLFIIEYFPYAECSKASIWIPDSLAKQYFNYIQVVAQHCIVLFLFRPKLILYVHVSQVLLDCLDQMSVSNPLKSSVTWDRWFLTD